MMLGQQRNPHTPDSFSKNLGEFLEKVVEARKPHLLPVQTLAVLQRLSCPSPFRPPVEKAPSTHLHSNPGAIPRNPVLLQALLGIIPDGTVFDQ